MSQSRKNLAVVAAVVLILLAGFFGWYVGRPSAAPPTAPPETLADNALPAAPPEPRVVAEAPLQITQPSITQPEAGDNATISASTDGKKWLICVDGLLMFQQGGVANRVLFNPGMQRQSLITAAAFMPDGAQVLTVDSRNSLQMFDLNAHVVWQMPPNPDLDGANVTTMAIDAAGKTAAFASGTNVVLVDIEKRNVISAFPAHADAISALGFVGSTRLLTGSRDRTLRLWDIASHKLVRTLEAHTQPVLTLAVSPDGRYALSGGLDARVILWNLDDGTILWRVRMPQDEAGDWAGRVVGTAFLDDGHRMLTSTMTTATLWDFDTHQPLVSWKFGRIGKIAIGLNGDSFRSGGRIWKIPFADLVPDAVGPSEPPPRGKLLRTFGPPLLADVPGANPVQMCIVRAMMPLPNDQAIAGYGGWNKPTIIRWDLQTGAVLARVEPSLSVFGEGGIRAFSPDGTLAAIVSGGDVHLVDASTGKDLRAIPAAGAAFSMTPIAFSPDGKFLLVPQNVPAAADDNPRVAVFDVATGAPVRTLDAAAAYVRALAFSSDGTRVAAGGGAVTTTTGPNVVQVWDFSTGKIVVQSPDHPAPFDAVAISARDHQVLNAAVRGAPMLWDSATGREIQKFNPHLNRNGHFDVTAVAFSPDGRYAATGGADNDIRLYALPQGAESTRFEWHQGAITALQFLPDNKRLLSSSADGTLRLWELP